MVRSTDDVLARRRAVVARAPVVTLVDALCATTTADSVLPIPHGAGRIVVVAGGLGSGRTTALVRAAVMIRGYTGGSNSPLGPNVEAMDLGDFDDFDQEYGLLVSKDSPKGQVIEKPMFGRIASGIDFLDSIETSGPSAAPTMEFNIRADEVTTATNVEIVFTFIIEASGSSD